MDETTRHKVHQDEQRRITSFLASIGDHYMSISELTVQLTNAFRALNSEITQNPSILDKLVMSILRCSVELPHKSSIYATLCALLCSSSNKTHAVLDSFGMRLIGGLISTFQNLFKEGSLPKCRRILRFLSELSNTRVISSDSFGQFLLNLLQSAISELENDQNASEMQSKPNARFYFLSDLATSTLPWCGNTLNEKSRALLDQIMQLSTYSFDVNARQNWSFLQPSLSGCESRQKLLQNTLIELSQIRNWKCTSILRPYEHFSIEINGVNPIELPQINIPAHSKKSRYSGPTYLLNQPFEQSENGLNELSISDRFVLAEYVHDILDNFESNHGLCAEMLMKLVQNESKSQVLVESIMSQMLNLNGSAFPLVYYGVVILDSCRIKNSNVPFALLNLTEYLYELTECMDAYVLDMFVEWFSYHLNNFGFRWNWEDWMENVHPDAQHTIPMKRLFTQLVLDRLIRLSNYEFMKEQIPSQLHSLLPPKPIPNESFELHQSVHSLLPFITGKTRVECSAVRSELFRMLPNESSGIRLKVLLQSILVASSKTLGHFDIISNRYLPLLMELSGDLSIEDERRTGCVLDLREFWMYSAMHVSYFVGRYLDLKLVSRINVLNAFIPDIQQDIVDGMHKLMRIDTWECVRSLVVRVFLAVTVAKKELATVAFEGSLATEGEAEIIAERIAQARFNVKERSNECEELITIAFSSLLMTFDRIVKYHKLQMSEQELDASLIRVLEWRISGMAREIARRDTEMCSIALIAFKESDVTAFETKTFELYEELKRIASSNLLKSEKP